MIIILKSSLLFNVKIVYAQNAYTRRIGSLCIVYQNICSLCVSLFQLNIQAQIFHILTKHLDYKMRNSKYESFDFSTSCSCITLLPSTYIFL